MSGISADIARLAQPSIRLNARLAASGSLPAGVTHLGGLPDLPVRTTWPEWKGSPMAFVAQVRLEEAAPFDSEKLLPAAGMLSFFYDASQETYGADPDDRGGWQVLYYANVAANWQPRQPPLELPSEARFKPCTVTFSNELTLPYSPVQVQAELKWSEGQVEGYESFLKGFPGAQEHASLHHRMFGHPNQLQDDMQLQCALMANGVRSLDEPGAADLVKTKEDWLLLIQVDSDYNAGMKWATSGLLYYWIERRALANYRFEQSWLVLQAE